MRYMTMEVRLPRRARLGIALALTLVGSSASPSTAPAHWNFNSWTHTTSGCANDRADPINVVYYGAFATIDTAHLLTYWGAEWKNMGGSPQWAITHGICKEMPRQHATACELCNRDHVRWLQNHDKDLKNRWETAGDAHHDVYAPSCFKHKASEFNEPRERLKNKVRPYLSSVTWVNEGNTAPKMQCDGTNLSSDGWQVWMLVSN